MNYSILLWFLKGTAAVMLAVGYPDKPPASSFLFGAGGISFYCSGLWDMFSSIEEEGKRERQEFAEKIEGI